ncbi:hypothetical protein GHAL_0497 [Hafnia alvei ATCC 13337]|uniref:Uncharacterized protein n=1 Tax=Hafnia alvei ATCC 13337 TaxID=910996 RepID=A0ABD3ZLT3_HAFAL|nr:hypothetical protein GHAL_0497 [Hafnia alvei ATCC 13337]
MVLKLNANIGLRALLGLNVRDFPADFNNTLTAYKRLIIIFNII